MFFCRDNHYKHSLGKSFSTLFPAPCSAKNKSHQRSLCGGICEQSAANSLLVSATQSGFICSPTETQGNSAVAGIPGMFLFTSTVNSTFLSKQLAKISVFFPQGLSLSPSSDEQSSHQQVFSTRRSIGFLTYQLNIRMPQSMETSKTEHGQNTKQQ